MGYSERYRVLTKRKDCLLIKVKTYITHVVKKKESLDVSNKITEERRSISILLRLD